MTDTLDPATAEPTVGIDVDVEAQVGALAERFVMAAIGSFELATVDLGVRLGLYPALAVAPATPADLAERAGINERYAREWLEQQATAGLVTIDSEALDGNPDARVFSLPIATQAILLDPDSLAYLAPLATMAVAGPPMVARLVDTFRTGAGVSFAEYGDDIRRAQEAANRPMFLNLLASEWLPAMPDVVATLEHGARVADVGTGCGWSAIAMALAYPSITVDGFDLDEASVVDARANAEATGVGERVKFEVRDAADAVAGSYDLVTCFEALHDMAHPVEALTAMRAMVAEGGTVFVVDERAADALTANDPDPIQRFFYAASVLHCLPVGMSQPHSAGTGTVMRTATLESYAAAAGFTAVEVLPIEHDMFRFYRLR